MSSLKDEELEDKIRQFWTVVQINPQLVRQELAAHNSEIGAQGHNDDETAEGARDDFVQSVLIANDSK